MKKIIFILFNIFFYANFTYAQFSVTVTGTNGTCLANATITATAKNNTGTVNYELLQAGSIVRPYQASNIFSNLPAGTSYTVQVLDLGSNKTAQSGSITLTTTYAAMTVSVPTCEVGCSTSTKDSLVVTVTGGKSPYTYSISPDPNNVGLQSSNKFYNLPVNTYAITVTDGCGATIATTSSVYATSTTVKDIIAGWGVAMFTYGNWTNGDYNNCAAGAYVNSDGGFQYRGSGGGSLSTFDQTHFYWRYQYPSKSGNIYGMGGILNGDSIPLTTRSVPMPASATYPFSAGDIIIYDLCGNSYGGNSSYSPNNVGMLQSSSTYLATFSPTYDCSKGGGIIINTRLYFIPVCVPTVTYTFTDVTNPATPPVSYTITNTKTFIASKPWPMSVAVYGLVAGDTYSITATDGQGHAVTNVSPTTTFTIPKIQGSIVSAGTNVDFNYYNSSFLSVTYPTTIAANSTVSYTVTASNSPAVQVGYYKSFSYSTDVIATPQFYGPNPDNSWPAGTYTVQVNNSPCLGNSIFTFTIPVTFKGIFNNNTTITPECGAFDISLQAALDSISTSSNISTYSVKIISGPNNVGLIKAFNTSPVSKVVNADKTTTTVCNSLNFNGLAYGRYIFGLMINGGSTPISYDTVTYSSNNALIINSISTGGYVPAGQSTGTLIVTATSAVGYALQYSINNGTTWQSSNIFNNLAVGTYPVMVKDACGNTASYNASIIQTTSFSASASPNPACAGSTVQLSVNAIGATSYAWTGPNGFTSSVQNPVINNVQPNSTGTYTVTVTTSSSIYTANVTLNVNALPAATISYNGSPFCATGTISPAITGTAGGTFSSTAGLTINASTGVINLLASNAGTYTVTYNFTDAVTGCSNTTATSVSINALPVVATTTQSVCTPNTVNLTASSITTGSTPGLSYGYYTDASGTTAITNPAAVAASGTYYIKGTNTTTGCYSIVPVMVNINALPAVIITNPAAVCSPNTVDLTASPVTAGSSNNLSFGYYTNATGGTANILNSPNAVKKSGTYYIQGTSTITGCSSVIMPVSAKVNICSIISNKFLQTKMQ